MFLRCVSQYRCFFIWLEVWKETLWKWSNVWPTDWISLEEKSHERGRPKDLNKANARIFLKVGVDTGVSYVSVYWATEESQFAFVWITVLHAYLINQNKELSGRVSAVPHVCIKSLKTWAYPLRAPHITFHLWWIRRRKRLI